MSEGNDSYPILTDCELLADAYIDAGKYQRAAQIFSRAIATIATIEAIRSLMHQALKANSPVEVQR